MSLRHFPHQDGSGHWHAAYLVPGTNIPSSVCVCLTKAGAQRVCAEENADQARKAAAAAAAAIHPADRKIPAGFYADGEAA